MLGYRPCLLCGFDIVSTGRHSLVPNCLRLTGGKWAAPVEGREREGKLGVPSPSCNASLASGIRALVRKPSRPHAELDLLRHAGPSYPRSLLGYACHIGSSRWAVDGRDGSYEGTTEYIPRYLRYFSPALPPYSEPSLMPLLHYPGSCLAVTCCSLL